MRERENEVSEQFRQKINVVSLQHWLINCKTHSIKTSFMGSIQIDTDEKNHQSHHKNTTPLFGLELNSSQEGNIQIQP